MKAIWAKKLRNEKNIMITFQYTMTPSEDTSLSLAASNLYRLFVDGELIGYGPARAAHGYSRLDNYSLAKWAAREVVLSVEVHSANVNTFYVVDESPFFAAEIKNGDVIVATAEDFTAYHMTERVQKVRRFSFQRSFTEIYHLQKNPASFYAGKVDGRIPVEIENVDMNQLLPRYVSYPMLDRCSAALLEWGAIGFDPDIKPWRDRAYFNIDPVTLKGFYPDELEEDSGEEAGQFTYTAGWNVKGGNLTGEENSKIGRMSYRIYDFGRTLTGFFSLKLKANADTTLYIIFDEVVTEHKTHMEVSPFRNDCCNVVKYTLAAGDYELITFEANSARYATVVVTEGNVRLDNFEMVLYENPDVSDFVYDYGDERLNKIVSAAINSFAQNAVDVLMDCPSRERAGWLCDSYFSSRAEALFTGKNLVEKSFLENYALCPQSPFLPEGMIPMCYPADHNDRKYIPNWSMWYILELNNYWKRTGDEAIRALSKEKVYGLIQFFEKYYNEYGLLENLESWVFIEWSKCNQQDYKKGVNYPSNMLWASALEAAAELYDDPLLARRGADMKKTIRELSWNGEFFEDNAIRDEDGRLVKTNHTTETCQYYAFYFETASREEYGELFDKLRIQFGPKRDVETVYPEVYISNAFMGNYLRLELLIRFGYFDQVLSECCDFFLSMAEMTGTLWEHSRLTASLDHGFASMAAVYIDECRKNLRNDT